MLLAFSGWRPGAGLNVLQCTGQFLTTTVETSLSKMSVESKLRKPIPYYAWVISHTHTVCLLLLCRYYPSVVYMFERHRESRSPEPHVPWTIVISTCRSHNTWRETGSGLSS